MIARILYLFLLYIACLPLRAEHEEFLVNLPEAIKETSARKPVTEFFDKVYQAIDIKPTYVHLPARRGFLNLRQHKIHAEGYRAQEVGQREFGDLYRINIPLASVRIGIFCLNKTSCTISADQTYAIQRSFEHGQAICEQLAITCKYEQSQGAITKLLYRNVVDAVISPYPAYESYLCRSRHPVAYFKELSDYAFTIYHYTNLRDDEMRRRLEDALGKSLNESPSPFAVFYADPSLAVCGKIIKEVIS
ncbi:hypothetical protein [Alteromonas ponticola]|uniref:ABC transporter substrate-binding protein n=1 Tax=Alteromonas ponticola TaxID=2720613 RepID=A0ABX1R1C9_9ALTE|nr:hypothetical protein [Alteromonas ponticola]NMH60273.1 hypothetical protein [Alteromonas ponticola]